MQNPKKPTVPVSTSSTSWSSSLSAKNLVPQDVTLREMELKGPAAWTAIVAVRYR